MAERPFWIDGPYRRPSDLVLREPVREPESRSSPVAPASSPALAPDAVAAPEIDLNALTARVYAQLERRIRIERDRRGM